MRHSQAAYTFFETMIALVIISILAAMSIPSLRNIIDRHNDILLQSQLLHTIQLARQEAHIRGAAVAICKSKTHRICGGDWSDGLLVFMDTDRNGIVKDAQDVIAITQVNTHQGSIHWRAFPFYRDYLRLLPNTWWAVDNGMFWYCRRGNDFPSFAIVLNVSGSSQVVYPDKSGKIKDSRNRIIHC